MNESAITAEDLALYALQSLDGAMTSRVELLLRSSSEARQELTQIWGDLAALGCSAPQHTPPALSRQRLLKQVARERRALPIPVATEEQRFAIDTPDVLNPDVLEPPVAGGEPTRFTRLTAEERRARVRLPRIVADPEPIFSAATDRPADLPPQSISPNVEGTPSAPGKDVSSTGQRLPASREDRSSPRESPIMFSSAPTQETVPEPPVSLRSSTSAERKPVAIFPLLSESDSLSAADVHDRYEPSTRRSLYEDETPTGHTKTAVMLGWAGWVAAAGLAAALLFSVRTNDSLQGRLHSQNVALAQTQANAAKADLVLQTLESGASQRFVLARQDTAPVPSARVAYLADHGSLVFQGTNLEALPPYKTYELWLIPAVKGGQPIPAGTFKPDARGYATLVTPSLPRGTVAGNFGVTIEDETGSATPTLPILLIGQG